MTEWPLSSRCSHNVEPRYPAAPVTRTFLDMRRDSLPWVDFSARRSNPSLTLRPLKDELQQRASYAMDRPAKSRGECLLVCARQNERMNGVEAASPFEYLRMY